MPSPADDRAPVVVVAGHVTASGGPALAAARAYQARGVTVRLVSAVGADFAAGALGGLTAAIRRGGQTTRLAAGRILARAEPVLAVDLPEAWRRCDLLHLAPIAAEVDVARWTQVARARLVGIEVAGFLRGPGRGGALAWRWPWQPPHGLAGVDAAYVDAAALGGVPDLAARLAAAVPIIAIDTGGAVEIRLHGRRIAELPAAASPAAILLAVLRGAPVQLGVVGAAG